MSVLTEEQALLKDMAKDFFANKAPLSLHRTLRDSKSEEGFSKELWSQMIDMGWPGINISEEHGGLNFGFKGLTILMEEAGRTLVASPLLSTVVLGASAIELGGNEAQKSELLPAIANGELLVALAADEGPHHDPSKTALTAEKDGDAYRLNGRKDFVLDGHVADKIVVLTRTSGSVGSIDGLSLFIVDASSEGVAISPRQMVDHRNASTISFDNARISADNLMGEIDKAGDLVQQILDRGRIALCCEMMGSMQQAFETILDYLRERKQFGQAIGGFQSLQHRAAIMFSDIEQCRSIIVEAIQAVEENRADCAELASTAKAMTNDAFHNISSEGIQMHGGMGMTDECDIGFYLKRARVAEQCLGSTNYHQTRFAEICGF